MAYELQRQGTEQALRAKALQKLHEQNAELRELQSGIMAAQVCHPVIPICHFGEGGETALQAQALQKLHEQIVELRELQSGIMAVQASHAVECQCCHIIAAASDTTWRCPRAAPARLMTAERTTCQGLRFVWSWLLRHADAAADYQLQRKALSRTQGCTSFRAACCLTWTVCAARRRCQLVNCGQAAMERDLQLQEAQLIAAHDKAADAAFGKMMQVQLQQVPPCLWPLIYDNAAAPCLPRTRRLMQPLARKWKSNRSRFCPAYFHASLPSSCDLRCLSATMEGSPEPRHIHSFCVCALEQIPSWLMLHRPLMHCICVMQEREAEQARAGDKIKAKEAARQALETQLQEKEAAARQEQVHHCPAACCHASCAY